MAFRSDEAARTGLEEVINYFVPAPRNADKATRDRSKNALLDIVDSLGPVVDSYPTWHPLVKNCGPFDTVTTPSNRCGYEGLDHTRLFVNGFITCPYGDGQKVLNSVSALPKHAAFEITAAELDVCLYNSDTTPILVKCDWTRPLPFDRMIPSSLAIPMILEKELPCWTDAGYAETWETMRPYFLGSPHGSRSSLFVNQDTGQTIKKIWEAIIFAGVFGPIKV